MSTQRIPDASRASGRRRAASGRGRKLSAWRPLIPYRRMLRSVTVFCGSNHGFEANYTNAARDLGALLARRGISIVYGGGSVGLMGELADSALAAGGEVIGVIPRSLWE